MAVVVVGLVAGCTPLPQGRSPIGDVPGAHGACGTQRHTATNPADRRLSITTLEPTGPGLAADGGRCDDDARPLAVVAHGYLGVLDAAYGALLDHLVSRGFVVVFPVWPIEFDPDHQYDVVDTGVRLAVANSARVDVARVGFVGHSYGAGMLPWLVQRAAERGWGTEATWATAFAPWFSLLLPDGPIEVPANTRFTTVHYRDDVIVDARIGIEVLDALAVPDDQKLHLTARSDQRGIPALTADHLGPVAFTIPWLGPLSVDALDRWAWRVVDTTSSCSLSGRWCDEDLTQVGTWPDGQAFRTAIASRDPLDSGPPALQECVFLMNPRPCPS
jgi:hypothetical protein